MQRGERTRLVKDEPGNVSLIHDSKKKKKSDVNLPDGERLTQSRPSGRLPGLPWEEFCSRLSNCVWTFGFEE